MALSVPEPQYSPRRDARWLSQRCPDSQVDVRVSTVVPTHAVSTDTSLDTVGLIPMASGSSDYRTEDLGGCGTSGCTPFYLKVTRFTETLEHICRCIIRLSVAVPPEFGVCNRRGNLSRVTMAWPGLVRVIDLRCMKLYTVDLEIRGHRTRLRSDVPSSRSKPCVAFQQSYGSE